MRWLLLAFLMCWAAVSMAGQNEQATIPKMPKPLKGVFEAQGYEAVKCELLEGAISCHPLSIAYSLQLNDREHDTSVIASVMNQLSTQQTIVSRFDGIDRQLRNSPHTQAAAVSYYLAARLHTALSSPSGLSQLRQTLERLSEQGHHSITLTALNTFQVIHQNAETDELSRRVLELTNDVRRDLNQFGSLETAVLLSMAAGESVFVVDGSNGSDINVITITNTGEQLTFSYDNVGVEESERLQSLITTGLDSSPLRFVVSPGYGLLPLQNLNVISQEQPAIIEGTLRRSVGYSRNQCSATCYDTRIRGFRDMGSDGQPVQSRVSPKLKKGLSKESIKDKWNRYYSQVGQGRQQLGKPGLPLYDVAWFFAVSALSSYMLFNGQIRNAIYQEICGTSDVRQCGKNYLYHAKESGEYILETGYGVICGVDDAWQCGSYYLNRSEDMASDILTAGYAKACGAMAWRECLKYYRGK